jgi:predicted methyltransferase
MTGRSYAFARPMVASTLPFALPIGLSAFLLFSVEPLVGRLVLPVFGGTPAVWATILFFFQAVLLAGYLYGHVSVTRLGQWGPPLHIAVAVLGFLMLLIAPTRIADLRIEAVTPVLDLLRILIVIVGLPAFVLTTTTPLLSGWFEAARSDREGDPYWLYALSNGGSLLALLAYPLIIEPRLGLTSQRQVWAVGYAALVVLLAVGATRVMPVLRSRAAEAMSSARVGALVSADPIDWSRRLRWLLLAAIPSGLLSAVTTFIATDLVSAPLLWVAPLAVYLASFIIAFSPRGGRGIRFATLAAPAMITLLWVPYGSAGGWPILVILAMELGAFGIVAVALHGRLAQDRPDPAHLTEFYLILSTGGALASGFVALVAPVVFPGVWEYPLLLIGALVALALVTSRVPRPSRDGRILDFRPFTMGFRARVLPYAAVGAAMIVGLVATGALATEAGIRWLLVGGLVLLVGARPWFLALSTAFVLALATFVLQPPAEFRARSFFGVTEVMKNPTGDLTLLMNGTTVHGSQSTDPAKARIPQSYYVENGPIGDLFRFENARSGGSLEVGVAGLGGGALAAYVEPGMAMTFFEIDPVVIQVASDPRYFTYLSGAPVPPAIVLGDARLSIEAEPAHRFDMLILDAFSSDSPPVHLFTVEAVADELRTVKPDGVIAFHVSNRYYDLAPPVAAAAARLGLTVLERYHSPAAIHEPGETASHWLAASSDATAIAALRADGWTDARPADRPFTDDYADLLHYLRLTN